MVLYQSSRRADAELRRLAEAAQELGTRVTVLALARQEPELRRCCDRRSVLWNRICRELASEDLAKATHAISGGAVELDTLVCSDRDAVDAVTREALVRGADQIVLADPSASGLGAIERWRLRRRSPIPVRA